MSGAPSLSALDLSIICAYFVLVIVVGLMLSRVASRGMDDYFLGGRRIPWWVLGASGSASNFDMTGTMVITSFFFVLGFQGFWVATRGGLVLCLAVLVAFMGKWLRRSKVLTTAEWMEFRFGSGKGGQLARGVAAGANLVLVIGMVVYFAKGTGLFVSRFLPFSAEVCSLGMVAIGLAYTVVSGLYGVVYTDIFQEIMLLLTAGYVIVRALFLPEHAAVVEAAGTEWTSLTPRWIADPMPWLENPAMYELFGLCLIFWTSKSILEGLGGMPGGYMAQRYYAARDERSASLMTAEWMGLLSFRWAMVAALAVLGLWVASRDPSVASTLQANPEKTLPVVLDRVLPAGLKGLALAGLIAAAMSTFDSTVNAGAAYWVKDIYHRYLRPTANERELVRQGYCASLLIGVLGVVLALGVPNINAIWNWITGPLAAGLFAPLVFRWYWERFNGHGFAAGTAVGVLAAISLELLGSGTAFYISFPVTISISASAAVIVSLLTPPVDPDTRARYFRQMRPFGFWKQSAIQLSDEARRQIRRENTIDFANVFLALGFQVCLFTTAVTLVMHNWAAMYMSLSATVMVGAILYFTWYRNLPPGGSAARTMTVPQSADRDPGQHAHPCGTTRYLP